MTWYTEVGSNHRRTAFQAVALPTELSVQESGCRGWIRTSDLELISAPSPGFAKPPEGVRGILGTAQRFLMRLVGTTGLPYPAYLASREGLEPSAFGFGDHCAANCATEILHGWSVYEDLNLGPLRPKRSALTRLGYTPKLW